MVDSIDPACRMNPADLRRIAVVGLADATSIGFALRPSGRSRKYARIRVPSGGAQLCPRILV